MNLVVFANFQDIENEDGVISFKALKMVTKIKKTTKQTILGQFFPISWSWKLLQETRKIPEFFSRCSPPGLISAV